VKGIILAGGAGTRLWPLTGPISKQLLPVWDKPMIFYPLSTLMLAGLKEILVITSPQDVERFQLLLGNGAEYGIRIQYAIQSEPKGLADAFIVGKSFIGSDDVCLILGDNIFYGAGLSASLAKKRPMRGADIFGYRVADPERYGVINFDKNLHPISIDEKPSKPKSNYAIPGLYFYDNQVIEIASNLKPSTRGEIEITDINRHYLENGLLNIEILPRGTAWLDTGTLASLHDASSYVKALEERQGLKIACLEEIAFRNGWIDSDSLRLASRKHPNSDYSKYLNTILMEHTSGLD
jgi:glucose-1-phosphate thymidylyltransferase